MSRIRPFYCRWDSDSPSFQVFDPTSAFVIQSESEPKAWGSSNTVTDCRQGRVSSAITVTQTSDQIFNFGCVTEALDPRLHAIGIYVKCRTVPCKPFWAHCLSIWSTSLEHCRPIMFLLNYVRTSVSRRTSNSLRKLLLGPDRMLRSWRLQVFPALPSHRLPMSIHFQWWCDKFQIPIHSISLPMCSVKMIVFLHVHHLWSLLPAAAKTLMIIYFMSTR